MGRPAKPVEEKLVRLDVRVKPAAAEWVERTAADLGVDRGELLRALFTKGAAAYSAGWRPRLAKQATS